MNFQSVQTSSIFKSKITETMIHVIFWIIVLVYQGVKYFNIDMKIDPFHCLVEFLMNVFPAYILYFIILPQKNNWFIIGSLPVLFGLSLYISYLLDVWLFDGLYLDFSELLFTLLRHLSIGLFFFALYAGKEMYRQQYQLNKIAKSEQQAKLRLLKSQINPHFLFNTLNTIYSSALTEADQTPELILKLSDNFRYVLHEGQQKQVSLSEEIRHIKDYINLQKARLTDKVIVEFDEEVTDYELQIAPLLLITFIENAFKYTSILQGKDHIISIHIKTSQDRLHFACVNDLPDPKNIDIESTWGEGGIGLSNVKERLALLYPKAHKLNISTENDKYDVRLEIEL